MKKLLTVLLCCVLASCASPDVEQYAAEKPALSLQDYLNGDLQAWGMFQDRSGEVIKRYPLRLPVGGRTWLVDLDDRMYLVDDNVMLNRAVMSKWGFTLGSITLSFYKP